MTLNALFNRGRAVAAGLVLAVCGAGAAQANGEVNLYSSRHYDTDERLYTEFTEATGIKVNRLEDDADVLISRIELEGENSPADLLITVDAGRLWRAEQAGLLAPVDSGVLQERIPADLRHPDGLWYGFSTRARVIYYDKARVEPAQVQTYADLADPKNKGLVCTRSSGNIYMISLMASVIHHRGRDAALEWAKGMWANRPREPQGGDLGQLRGIASGECAISVGNSYYFARALRLDVRGLRNPEDTSRIGIVFPNQETTGTHVNISGAGLVTSAPNRENAIAFLEYLASDSAQSYFANGNDEYPVVEGVDAASHVEGLGEFRRDTINLSILGENQAEARKVYDEAGYK